MRSHFASYQIRGGRSGVATTNIMENGESNDRKIWLIGCIKVVYSFDMLLAIFTERSDI